MAGIIHLSVQEMTLSHSCLSDQVLTAGWSAPHFEKEPQSSCLSGGDENIGR